MNPPDWDSVEWATVQDYDRPQWAGPEQDIGKYTVNYNDPHDQQDHYRYHPREPQRPTRRMEFGQHSIPSPSPSTGPRSGREPAVDLGSVRIMTLDGASVEGASVDNQLERKKKKLEELENQIIRRKAAIALKKVLPYLKKNDELSDNPAGDQKDLRERCLTITNESSLKERVNCILKLRKSLGLPKVSSELADLTYSGPKGLSIDVNLLFYALFRPHVSSSHQYLIGPHICRANTSPDSRHSLLFPKPRPTKVNLVN